MLSRFLPRKRKANSRTHSRRFVPLAAALASLATSACVASEPIDGPKAANLSSGKLNCANNVEELLTSKRTLNAEVMGFNTGAVFDPSSSEHIQGIARYEHDGRQYLFITQNRKGKIPGILATVEIASRKGERLRSNRTLFVNGRSSNYSGPPRHDRVVAIKTDEGFANYNHPGGLAIHGDILAVGMEGSLDQSRYPKGRVDFYRIENPTLLRFISSVSNSGQMAASVAMTRLASGHYLIAVPDNSPKNIRFYRSIENGDLNSETKFEHVAAFSESDLKPGDNNYFQNLDFVTDCATGRLYMILAFQDHDMWGLWRKDRLARYEILDPGGTPALRHLGRQKINCSPIFANSLCNLDAAFGTFVSPSGDLIYYATESANSGWDGSVNFGEFVAN